MDQNHLFQIFLNASLQPQTISCTARCHSKWPLYRCVELIKGAGPDASSLRHKEEKRPCTEPVTLRAAPCQVPTVCAPYAHNTGQRTVEAPIPEILAGQTGPCVESARHWARLSTTSSKAAVIRNLGHFNQMSSLSRPLGPRSWGFVPLSDSLCSLCLSFDAVWPLLLQSWNMSECD